MTLSVTGLELVPPNAYEGFWLADIDTYDGVDSKGQEFSSLKFTFDMKYCVAEGCELVIFTSNIISPESRAGEIISGILGHPIKRGDKVEETNLYRVPLKALIGTRTKRNGGEVNTISNIERLGDQLPHGLEYDEAEEYDGVEEDDPPF